MYLIADIKCNYCQYYMTLKIITVSSLILRYFTQLLMNKLSAFSAR